MVWDLCCFCGLLGTPECCAFRDRLVLLVGGVDVVG